MNNKPQGHGFFDVTSSRKSGIMSRKFIIPPFSVFDSRSGAWLERKRAWKELGLRGEEGRQEGAGLGVSYGTSLDGHGGGLRGSYDEKEAIEEAKEAFEGQGRAFNLQDMDMMRRRTGVRKRNKRQTDTGVSIFDPVLCEVMYRWFCTDKGSILDPFAGGATRGIVASVLGYEYYGIEIRERQIVANEEQAKAIGAAPYWFHGDSMKIKSILKRNLAEEDPKFDLLFTCPPYYDLEVYSINEKDGSTHKTYDDFIDWYYTIFKRATRYLKNNRFAVVVVGEIRDKKTGEYRNFVADTIDVFLDLGFAYYNEMILINATGSLPLRAGKQMKATRKIGKQHQNVLCFYKGDPSKIKQNFPKSEYIGESEAPDV